MGDLTWTPAASFHPSIPPGWWADLPQGGRLSLLHNGAAYTLDWHPEDRDPVCLVRSATPAQCRAVAAAKHHELTPALLAD